MRSSVKKGKISTKIVYKDTTIKLIYRYRLENDVPMKWATHSKFNPLNVKMNKQPTKLPDLFKGKCVYVRLHVDSESPDVLKEIFVNALEQTNNERIVTSSKQTAVVHFKTPDEAKSAIEIINTIQIMGDS